MSKGLFIRLSVLIVMSSFFLYKYIDKQNYITTLRMQLPELQKEIHILMEENKRLQYAIDQFEHPSHLMELARSLEFSHLKHPIVTDVLSLQQGTALQEPKTDAHHDIIGKKSIPVAFGAK